MLKKIPIRRIVDKEVSDIEDVVVREHTATILVNDQQVVSLLCSPSHLEELAVGFLLSEKLISNKSDIVDTSVTVGDNESTVYVKIKESPGIIRYISSGRLIASSGGKSIATDSGTAGSGISKIISAMEIPHDRIFSLMKEFHGRSPVFTATGGVHSVALCSIDDILVFHHDIGRHNAMDKVLGESFIREINAGESMIFTSGRVSSEILLKVAQRGIPVIVSVSAPTDKAVELAESIGVTLVGFVRGHKMNIYSHAWRIKSDGRQR